MHGQLQGVVGRSISELLCIPLRASCSSSLCLSLTSSRSRFLVLSNTSNTACFVACLFPSSSSYRHHFCSRHRSFSTLSLEAVCDSAPNLLSSPALRLEARYCRGFGCFESEAGATDEVLLKHCLASCLASCSSSCDRRFPPHTVIFLRASCGGELTVSPRKTAGFADEHRTFFFLCCFFC